MAIEHDTSTKYTDIMVARFKKRIQESAAVDQADMKAENYYLNGNKLLESYRQADPEYSQQSFLRMRAQEEASPLYDYMNVHSNKRY